MKKLSLIFFSTLLGVATGFAANIVVPIYATNDESKQLGQVAFSDTGYGLLVSPALKALPPGLHGFHLHQHASCSEHGAGAGGHYDPHNTNSHLGPYGNGHLGDLPVLYVKADGTADTTTLAPRLKTSDLKGLSVMIHADGDNYSNTPPLGGGGARMACGAVK